MNIASAETYFGQNFQTWEIAGLFSSMPTGSIDVLNWDEAKIFNAIYWCVFFFCLFFYLSLFESAADLCGLPLLRVLRLGSVPRSHVHGPVQQSEGVHEAIWGTAANHVLHEIRLVSFSFELIYKANVNMYSSKVHAHDRKKKDTASLRSTYRRFMSWPLFYKTAYFGFKEEDKKLRFPDA